MEEKKKNWDGRTGGGTFGQKFMFYFFRHGSIAFGYFIVGIAIFFYMIVNFRATRNIYHYFRRRQKYTTFKSAISVYKNHFLFGKIVIDRFSIFAGRRKDYHITEINKKAFDEVSFDKDKGGIILYSHVGCSEIAGYVLSETEKRFNIIVYGGESAVVQQNRSELLTAKNISLIPVTDGFSHMFAVSDALKNKELLGMYADRIYEGSQNIECDFLGAKALFPLGAFKLAVKFKVPVLAIYVMQNGYKKYMVHTIRLENDANPASTVNEKIHYLSKQYVGSLEAILKKYPLQWYNFHPFWTDDLNKK